MRNFNPIIYICLMVFAVSTAGCDLGVAVLEAAISAVQEEEVEVQETRLAYHQRRIQEVDGPGWTDLHRAAAIGDVPQSRNYSIRVYR